MLSSFLKKATSGTILHRNGMVIAGIRGKEFSTLMEFQIVPFPSIKCKLSCRLSYFIILQHYKNFTYYNFSSKLQLLPIDFSTTEAGRRKLLGFLENDGLLNRQLQC